MKKDLEKLFKQDPTYPVTLENGYQLLTPQEHMDRGALRLRLYDPTHDTVVYWSVPYSSLARASVSSNSTVVDKTLRLMVAELDTCGWVFRAFRHMPRAWKSELLTRLQGPP